MGMSYLSILMFSSGINIWYWGVHNKLCEFNFCIYYLFIIIPSVHDTHWFSFHVVQFPLLLNMRNIVGQWGWYSEERDKPVFQNGTEQYDSRLMFTRCTVYVYAGFLAQPYWRFSWFSPASLGRWWSNSTLK